MGVWKFLVSIFIAAGSLVHAGDGPPRYETGEELLVAVNEKLREMGRPEYTLDGLTVWLARQADSARSDGLLPPRLEPFLRELVAGERFTYPVGLRVVDAEGVRLGEGSGADDILRLPPHKLLEVNIFNVPWGSRDQDGNRLKIVWSSIVVATALGSGD